MKKIPYGIDNFERIVNDDLYLVDKTMYIPVVEKHSPFLLLARPRRMGKSLFVNMLMAYYDIANKDRFDSLFGDLWIGKHPTKEANRYLVLKFDFSHISSGCDSLTEDFTSYCRVCVQNFLDRYREYFSAEDCETILSQKTAKLSVVTLTQRAALHGLHLYLFIDEYDNFSNVVLSARGVDAHYQITHGEGFYREFFKALKGTFDRIFMTGVTPVTYDDLTSGFNIADVVALEPEFNDAIGVTETELRAMIGYYRDAGQVTPPADDIVAEMKPWYDGFCFCDDCYGVEPPIYNTDMVMRYMQSVISKGKGPRELLDRNAQTDTKKLDFLVMSEDLDNRESRIAIIKEICDKGYIAGHVKERFPASECGDEENFKSMLYYFGTLTFGGWDEYGETVLQVPNKTMGELYLQYMLKVIEREGLNVKNEIKLLEESIREAAVNHHWQQLAEKLGALYSRYSSIRNTAGREADVNGFMRGVLCLNRYFALWPELELGKGFCDILLVPKGEPRCPTKYSYLIELKFMRVDEADVTAYVAEACRQLDRYASDYHLADSPLLRDTSLTKLFMVFRANELVQYGVKD